MTTLSLLAERLNLHFRIESTAIQEGAIDCLMCNQNERYLLRIRPDSLSIEHHSLFIPTEVTVAFCHPDGELLDFQVRGHEFMNKAAWLLQSYLRYTKLHVYQENGPKRNPIELILQRMILFDTKYPPDTFGPFEQEIASVLGEYYVILPTIRAIANGTITSHEQMLASWTTPAARHLQ